MVFVPVRGADRWFTSPTVEVRRRLIGVVLDAQGNLYGTTYEGGDAACDAPYGCGPVFKLDTTGKETVLHSLTPKPDGANPHAGLVLDARATCMARPTRAEIQAATWAAGRCTWWTRPARRLCSTDSTGLRGTAEIPGL